MYHIAEAGYPKFTCKPSEHIKNLRHYLEDDPEGLLILDNYNNVELNHYPAFTDELLEELVNQSKYSKYSSRKSPAFTASYFNGYKLKGNDGKYYIGVANAKGVVQWNPCKE